MQHRDKPVQVIRTDVDIGVGDHQDSMARRFHHIDQVADFAVSAVQRRIDGQSDIEIGKARLQAAHHGDRRIGRVLHAKQDLKLRVALPAQCGQRRFQQRLVAVQRLQHGDRRTRGR